MSFSTILPLNPQETQLPGGHALSQHKPARWPEWCALSFYCAIVASAIPWHEPWADEAQAWQMARTLSLPALFTTYIRYEGSPGLWHFILWLLVHAHVGYTALHWICAGIAVASTSLLIFRSPFPRYLKLALPFTYFLVFQYAVIARSYVLVPPLLFMVALWWKKRPLTVAVLLGLLANVSLHAAVLSGGFALVWLADDLRSGPFRDAPRRTGLVRFTLILAAFYSFAIWTAWPARDCAFQAKTMSFTAGALDSIVWGICQPWILSIPFWIAIALCLHDRRSLRYVTPILLFAVFSGAVHVNWWHAGLLVPAVICILWITWPQPGSVASRSELIGRGALVVLIAVQFLWTGYALAFDHTHDYSPDRAAAEFLAPYVQNRTPIAVTFLGKPPEDHDFWAVGIQPYFDRNIYANQSEAFWWWSRSNAAEQRFHALLRSHPPIVVAEMLAQYYGQPVDQSNPKIRLLTASGYTLTNLFCGVQPQRLAPGPANCHLIFRYAGAAPTAPGPQTAPPGGQVPTASR